MLSEKSYIGSVCNHLHNINILYNIFSFRYISDTLNMDGNVTL